MSSSLLSYTVKNPLCLVTLGQTKCDNINRMVPITGDFYLITPSKWYI